MTNPKVPERLLTKIRGGHRFLLTSHINPDGDAIGSEIGLGRILRMMGKGATIWNRDPTPQVYQQLPGTARIHVGEEPPAGFPDLFDAVIVLECPAPERYGLANLGSLPRINIDHHLGNSHYGNINWIDTASPAVGAMIFRLAKTLKLDLDRDTANALYLTLVTDTGGFRYSNTTPEAFETAAELVREGASPQTVSTWLYESRSLSALRLLGEVLPSIELHHEGRAATARLTREMVENAGAEQGDSEGLIDYPRSIAGVQAAALFRETEEGGTKVSLRSRGEIDVEKIARKNGGGGHHNAAGYSSTSDFETVRDQTLEALESALDSKRATDTAESEE